MQSRSLIKIDHPGAPDVMRLEEAPIRPPAPDEALVKVAAAGVNFYDTQLRSGFYLRQMPLALGNEGAGVVEAAGETSGFRAGDRVVWVSVPGSYATHVTAPARALMHLPDAVNCEVAAGAMFQGLTAHYLAHSAYVLKDGDTCIVHSAAGGVGALLCQMAKLRGARVIGTVSSIDKADAAHAAGADRVIVYKTDDFAEAALEFTDGVGAHVIYDAVGKETFERSLKSLRVRGALVVYGEASGAIPPFDLRALSDKSLYLTRTGLSAYISDPDEMRWRATEVLGWLATGAIRQHIRSFPLKHAADAHRLLESRASVGKMILVP